MCLVFNFSRKRLKSLHFDSRGITMNQEKKDLEHSPDLKLLMSARAANMIYMNWPRT